MKVAIQGFGNAGQAFAKRMQEEGYQIVAVSDSRGAIYRPKGFDVPSLVHMKEISNSVKAVYCTGSVCSEVEAQHITNEELLELDVDILVPAALENQINKDNASKIKAKYIVELANGPTLSEADPILAERGILVIPDILANAGGVTVSYFEWVQNRTGFYWDNQRVEDELKRFMKSAFLETFIFHKEKVCTMRDAAYAVALTRICEAIEAHGTQSFFSNPQNRT